MAREPRVPKTLRQKLQEFDDEHFLLRGDLHSLCDDRAHARTIAARLRNLLCASGKPPGASKPTEGLLWRLVDELGVSDEIYLKAAESVNRDHPLNRGLSFMKIPLHRGDQGPPGGQPGMHSLRYIIRKCEAIYVPNLSSTFLTHERLIKAAAQQIGTAHVDDTIELSLLRALTPPFFGANPIIETLAFDAELSLQVGERVLEHAEKTHGHRRVRRPATKGDASLVIRFSPRDALVGKVELVTVRSEISEVKITCYAGPQSAVFQTFKRGHQISEVRAPYPDNWGPGSDVVFIFSYSSAHRQARVITNDQASEAVACDAGWLDARELGPPVISERVQEFVNLRWVWTYERLLGSNDGGELGRLSPDARELLMTSRPSPGIFPD